MSSLKKVVQEIWEHIQDSGKDLKQFPKDLEDSVRNSILRQPQTLRNYNITTALNQRELLDTLQWFHSNNIQNIKNYLITFFITANVCAILNPAPKYTYLALLFHPV